MTANDKIIDSYQNHNVVSVNQDTVKKCLKLNKLHLSILPCCFLLPKSNSESKFSCCCSNLIDQRAEAALVVGSEKQNMHNELNLTFVNFMTTVLAVNLKNYLELQNLKQLAELDEGTGLYNQNYMRRRLLSEVRKARRYNQIFSIVLLDLNNFKQINDFWSFNRRQNA